MGEKTIVEIGEVVQVGDAMPVARFAMVGRSASRWERNSYTV